MNIQDVLIDRPRPDGPDTNDQPRPEPPPTDDGGGGGDVYTDP